MTWEKRADIASYLGMAFVAGWISCQSYYGLTTLWKAQDKLVHVEQTEVPKLKTNLKQADCDRAKLASVAGEAIASAQSNSIPTPNYSDISDCPKVAPVKAPPVAAILPHK